MSEKLRAADLATSTAAAATRAPGFSTGFHAYAIPSPTPRSGSRGPLTRPLKGPAVLQRGFQVKVAGNVFPPAQP